MNILHIIPSIYPDAIGGAEIVTYNITKELKKKHTVHIETRDKNYMYYLSKGKDFYYITHLYNKYRNQKIDIIHCHFYTYSHIGSMLSKLLKCKLIIHLHGSAYYNNRNKLHDKMLQTANSIIICNEDLNYLPNSIKLPTPINYFDNNTIEKNYIIYYGRIHPIKNIELLINTMNQIKEDIPLYVVGSISDNKYLEKLKSLRSNGTKISFFTDINRKKCMVLLKECRFFINPYVGNGVSITTKEAMAFNKSCIVLGSNIDKELSDSLIISNEEDLKNDIINLWNNKQIRWELGRKAYNTIEQYSIENITLLYESLYKDVLN